MFNFIKKIFKKKSNVYSIGLNLHEIKDLAELVGFTISDVPENYESIKDDMNYAMYLHEDNVDGFAWFNDDGVCSEVYRVVCSHYYDDNYDPIYTLGENLLENE